MKLQNAAWTLSIAFAIPAAICLLPAAADPPPNMLWISCEDISPHLGCYGDANATTPNLDRLATQGVRFTQAHHCHGVCRPARTGIILGMWPTSVGCNHMRCEGQLPRHIKPFPYYLRQAGYYCTNNSKTDYAFQWNPDEVWDESSRTAHYRNRSNPEQPFFAVFNFTCTHESRVWPENHAGVMKSLPIPERHDPGKMVVPPYYPDTPKVRGSLARLYDIITAMDTEVGRVLRELEEDGLAENTIVFFWSDHGDGLPRAKRWIYDSGTRVPLLVRIPPSLRAGNQATPGSTDNRLVSMIDLGPTVLHLAGVDVPDHMHGRPLLGPDVPAPRPYVYAARDRIDERYDMVRMVRDGQYRYVRNFMPWYTWLRKINYAERNAIRQEMRRLLADGTLRPEAAQWLAPTRPAEELYHLDEDPFEVKNVAGDPRHAAALERLRAECDRWMLRTRDAHLLAEPFLQDADEEHGTRRAAVRGPTGAARVARLLAAAKLATRKPSPAALLPLLADDDPAVRWWAAMGLGTCPAEEGDAPGVAGLRQRLRDPSPAVRVAVAWGLSRQGHQQAALPVLTESLQARNPWTRLWAIQALDEMGDAARGVLPSVRAAGVDQSNQYVTRVVQQVLEKFDEAR
jgi:uncharacterized sulfatase